MLNRKPYVDDFARELLNRACEMLKDRKINNENFLTAVERINNSNDAYYIEFLALPCRIGEGFFTSLAGIENYFKEV